MEVYVIFALAGLGILLTAHLLTRPRPNAIGRCHCGEAASVVLGERYYCARHGWQQMERDHARGIEH